MDLILGVDAGNTKTVAVIATSDGEIIGAGRSGCGDIYGAGSPEAALSSVRNAVTAALEMADVIAEDIEFAGFSMAGADWPEDYELLEKELKKLHYGKKQIVVNDAIGGLRAGSPDGCGVAAILGTGSAIGSRNRTGYFWTGGFWLRSVHTHDLIEQLYDAVFQAELGIMQTTSLTGRVLEIAGEDTVERLLHSLTRRGAKPQHKRGRLLSALMDEAVAGDESALSIIQAYTNRCGEYAVTAARYAQFTEQSSFYLVFAGGMTRHPSGIIVDMVSGRVHNDYPGAVPVNSQLQPVIGAVLLGFDVGGHSVTDEVMNNLKSSMPDASFFSTADA